MKLLAAKPIVALLVGLTGNMFGSASALTNHSHPIVNTTSGTIEGHASALYPLVHEYLGIPFAQPPIADLRFAPPRRYTSDSYLVADQEPLSCTQPPRPINYSQPENWQNMARSNGYANKSGEDCLYLSVWSKDSSSGAAGLQQPKPVLVYFYGGGFHSGGAADPKLDGAIWAQEQGVVFVNFNYRLGIFGFSGAPGQTQNVAFLDQRMAVEWVRDNIASFGGDPDRITIFGHSAGGASVDFYDFAWLDDPIVAGVVPMSGSVNSFGRRLANTSAAGWDTTAGLVGCDTSSGEAGGADTLSCMRNIRAEELLSASTNASEMVIQTLDPMSRRYASITGLFGPTIDNKTVFANYSQRAAQGYLSGTPAVLGSNTDEGCLFAEEGQVAATTTKEFEITEVVFTCPLEWGAVWRASAEVPTWKYLYKGAYPNLYAPACPGRPWHGQELYVMFNASESATGLPGTAQELSVGKYLRTAWAAFAADPRGGLSSSSSSSLDWPTFEENKLRAVMLAGNSTVEEVGNDAVIAGLCLTVFRDGAPNY